MYKIRVIGSGEAFSSDLGNTSYLLKGKAGVPTTLFDCGYQIPERLWKQKLHVDIQCICFTHLHADHSFGVVPLLVRYWEERRRETLTIIGPKGTRSFVEKILNLGYPGIRPQLSFSLVFKEISEGEVLRIGKMSLRVARTFHSVLNYSTRVDLPGARSFVVSGDGQVTDGTLQLVSGADLLLQEVYSLRPGIPVHADLQTLTRELSNMRVGAIGAGHFSRKEAKRIEEALLKIREKDPRWFTLLCGTQIDL